MSSEREIEELEEWFRSLPPAEILQFVLTLPEENQKMIKYWAHHFAQYEKKATFWKRALDPYGRIYYQNHRTKETHWARAMTAGSGALDACTGIPYHVPLD